MGGSRRVLVVTAAALGWAAPGLAYAADALPTVRFPWVRVELGAAAALFALVAAVLYVRQRRDLKRLQAAESARALDAAAFDALPHARMVINPGGRAVIHNTMWTHLFALDASAPLAPLEAQLAGDADALAQLGRLKAAAQAGASARAEFQVTTREGAHEWRDVLVAPLPGRPGYVLWGMEDITARKEMEQVIREEQERLIDFLENAPIGFYSVDEAGRFQFVNNTLAGWLGHTPEEITAGGKLLHDFLAGGARGDGAAHSPFGVGPEREQGEVTLRGRDGRPFSAYVTQTVVHAENGGLRTRSLVRDLTIEREWADALKQSEQRFQRFFEEAAVGIVLLDAAGKVVEHNAAFARMVGVDAGEAKGRPFADFVEAAARGTLAAQLQNAAGPGDAAPIELTLSGGDARVVASAVIRRIEEGGEAAGLIVHLVDITEQKTLEAQFLQSQKMELVGQLAGGVAHDFNNLLTAMIGFCDLLLMRHRPGDQSFADIMQIRQNANRAANLVRQLLAFSRQQTLQPKVLSVTDVLAELSNLLRRLIGASIDLKMVHGRELGLVRVDQGQLEQVIINLAVNARDAMVAGGTLEIRTVNVPAGDPRLVALDPAPDTDYVAIEMEDTGCGIAKENLAKIFEPFFTTKEVGSGTGLGLSTVYGIIKQTGGLIAVDSSPTVGTTFTIFLPRHRSEAEAEAPREVPPRERAPRRDLTGEGVVLLVEDEDAVRKFGARALRNKGYTVHEAANGETALEILNSGEPVDILVTDVVMPGVDGPSLIRQVREKRPDLRVICISGYTEDSFRKRIDFSDNIHFLPKPFSLQQLAGKVKEVISDPVA